eukprot:348247_1
MGNRNSLKQKPSHDYSENFIKMYSRLINMGFDESKSIKAATKYPNNLNKAIDYINKLQSKSNDEKKHQFTKYVTLIEYISTRNLIEIVANTNSFEENKKSNNTQHKLRSKVMDEKNDDVKQNECIDFNNICNGICTCKALDILIGELTYYQKYNENEVDMDTILKYFTLN